MFEKEKGINNYSQNSINTSFLNKFQHLESIYLKKSTLCQKVPDMSMALTDNAREKNKRRSRKSVLLMTNSTRKSFMEIKRDIFLNTTTQEKTKTTIKKIELNNYTPDQILDVIYVYINIYKYFCQVYENFS